MADRKGGVRERYDGGRLRNKASVEIALKTPLDVTGLFLAVSMLLRWREQIVSKRVHKAHEHKRLLTKRFRMYLHLMRDRASKAKKGKLCQQPHGLSGKELRLEKSHLSGSAREGTEVFFNHSRSDVDVMIQFDLTTLVSGWSVVPSDKDTDFEFTLEDTERPGFVNLRIRSRSDPGERDEKLLIDKTIHTVMQGFEQFFLESGPLDTTHGAEQPQIVKCWCAKPNMILEWDDDTKVDLVSCIVCKTWPYQAFKERRRSSGQPRDALVNRMCRTPIFLVTKPGALRLSFSRQETAMLRSITKVQRTCLVIMKHCAALLPNSERCPSTYHFKTALMWLCERRSPDLWTWQGMQASLEALLHFLLDCYKTGSLPCYFYPDINLIYDWDALKRSRYRESVKKLWSRLPAYAAMMVTGLLKDNRAGLVRRIIGPQLVKDVPALQQSEDTAARRQDRNTQARRQAKYKPARRLDEDSPARRQTGDSKSSPAEKMAAQLAERVTTRLKKHISAPLTEHLMTGLSEYVSVLLTECITTSLTRDSMAQLCEYRTARRAEYITSQHAEHIGERVAEKIVNQLSKDTVTRQLNSVVIQRTENTGKTLAKSIVTKLVKHLSEQLTETIAAQLKIYIQARQAEDMASKMAEELMSQLTGDLTTWLTQHIMDQLVRVLPGLISKSFKARLFAYTSEQQSEGMPGRQERREDDTVVARLTKDIKTRLAKKIPAQLTENIMTWLDANLEAKLTKDILKVGNFRRWMDGTLWSTDFLEPFQWEALPDRYRQPGWFAKHGRDTDSEGEGEPDESWLQHDKGEERSADIIWLNRKSKEKPKTVHLLGHIDFDFGNERHKNQSGRAKIRPNQRETEAFLKRF